MIHGCWLRGAAAAMCVVLAPSLAAAGNVTWTGPTGMFLNPTAETPPHGGVMPQACWLHQDQGGGTFDGVMAMGSYTFPSNTEVGALLLSLDLPSGDTETEPGAFVRQLLLSSEGFRPALAVGGAFIEGDPLTRQDVFAALAQPLTPADVAVAVRLHLGARWRFAGNRDDLIPYGGLELGFSEAWSVFVETAERSDFDRRTPYAAGVQFHGKRGLGLSLAAGNSGSGDDLGFFFGIGYLFTGS
jgi:hypothetical protein